MLVNFKLFTILRQVTIFFTFLFEWKKLKWTFANPYKYSISTFPIEHTYEVWSNFDVKGLTGKHIGDLHSFVKVILTFLRDIKWTKNKLWFCKWNISVKPAYNDHTQVQNLWLLLTRGRCSDVALCYNM